MIVLKDEIQKFMPKNKEGKDYQLQKKKKHLLENLTISSVDLCRRRANQEAYICLKFSSRLIGAVTAVISSYVNKSERTM